jgi:hypothetical protein
MNWAQRTPEGVELFESDTNDSDILLPLIGCGFIGRCIGSTRGLPEDDGPGTRTKRGTNHNKTILMMVWNSNSFHFIDAMPEREKRSTQYYIDNILTLICRRLIPAGKCKFVIHADNSWCHTANVILDFVSQRKVRFTMHPRCSPDIARSDLSFLVT